MPEPPKSFADRLIEGVCALGGVLVLPLSALLFSQWPLREWAGGGAPLANDLGQICFALFIGVAVTYATRRRAHLAADAWAQRYTRRTRLRLERAAALLIALPWAAFVLYAAWPSLWRSVVQLERFAETDDPGYFLLRVAVGVMAALVLAQALLDGLRRRG